VIPRLWEHSWAEHTAFSLIFSVELRTLVATTNTRFHRATRQREHFPTEQAALKILYLITQENCLFSCAIYVILNKSRTHIHLLFMLTLYHDHNPVSQRLVLPSTL